MKGCLSVQVSCAQKLIPDYTAPEATRQRALLRAGQMSITDPTEIESPVNAELEDPTIAVEDHKVSVRTMCRWLTK